MRNYIIFGCLTAALLIAGIVLFFAGVRYPLQIVVNLTFGWIAFAVSVFPNVRLDPSGIITAVICVAFLFLGLHWLCRSMYAHVPKLKGAEAAPWRWRWTTALVSVFVLMFIAGISAVGMTHQTVWLASSPEPLIERGQLLARTEAVNNLRLVNNTSLSYVDAHQRLPHSTFDKDGKGIHSWQTELLILLDRPALYQLIDTTKPWKHPRNRRHFKNVVEYYWYPGSDIIRNEEGLALSHYASNVHVISGMRVGESRPMPDGAANTIMIGQVGQKHRPWGDPVNWRDPALGINASPDGFGDLSGSGALFAFGDGSVRYLKNDVSRDVLKSLSKPADINR